MTSTIDLAALARCLDIARLDPREAERIDGKLAKEDGDWLDVATAACYSVQMERLGLPPWRLPPCVAHVEQPRRDVEGYELLQRLLAAGLSRYEPDALAALAEAEKRAATPAR